MSEKQETALEQFDTYPEIMNETPLEQLRFFCSFAMSHDDWLDSEEFFDAVEAQINGDL